MLKSGEISGFPIKVEMSQVLVKHYEYVINVSTDLNAPNGVFIKNVTAFGEDSLPMTEKEFVVNAT